MRQIAIAPGHDIYLLSIEAQLGNSCPDFNSLPQFCHALK